MPNKNYLKGAAYEARFIYKLKEKGHAVKGGRFYASKGVTDVWWVDKKGTHHEAQLKYSTYKEPYIAPHEMQELKNFAREMDGIMDIWLVLKKARRAVDMRLIK